MRGIGGPLLCIGDLLSDVGEENEEGGASSSSFHPSSLSDLNNQPLPDLTKLFQENYDHLNEALNTTDDHSWTSLTLKVSFPLIIFIIIALVYV